MKKMKLLWVAFIFSTLTAFATETTLGHINGNVLDANTNQPLPYVSVTLQYANGTIFTGTVTDHKGYFEINEIPDGNFVILLSFIGYDTLKKNMLISKDNKNYQFKKLLLTENREALDVVEVVAEKTTIEQKIDRKVINVGKDLTSVGATASELLNNVQSVSVDSQTGDISLRGNENVRVLVDGKPSNISAAQLLKQIPSTSIKTIELITNPSAKYNPEGMSGIINIILHKNSNLGFNGSANVSVTYGLNPRYNYATNMNLKTGKVNFFANYGLRRGTSENKGYIIRKDNSIHQDFNFKEEYAKHLLKLGADIYINDRQTFSVYTLQNIFDETNSAKTLITGDTNSNSYSVNDVYGDSQDYNFNYTIDLNTKGEKLEVEANFSVFDKTQDAVFKELVMPYDLTSNYADKVVDDRARQLYNLDYTKPLSKNAKLEAGLEARLQLLDNNNQNSQNSFVYDTDENLIPETIIVDGTSIDWYKTTPVGNSAFTYDRSIYSAYINYNQKFDKLSMQLGARLEDYKVNGDYFQNNEEATYKDQKFSIYPSAFFTYNPNKKNQFQLSYSKRVDRPSKSQVNPIRQWSTPLLTSIGNPDLKQQFTNSFELNYTYQYKKGSLTAGTFLRLVNDNITRVLNIDELNPDKLELSYINADSSSRYGFEVSSNHTFFKWWRMNASTDLYIQKESGIANNEFIEVQNNAFNFRVNHSFTATKDLRFQLFGMYRGGGRSIQFDVEPMWMVNTGASYNVLKGKGRINLNFNDIFNSMKFQFDANKPIPQYGQFRWESRTVTLGFMYNFGGGKNKARKRKSRKGNDSDSGGFL